MAVWGQSWKAVCGCLSEGVVRKTGTTLGMQTGKDLI